jgi:hypothetical protein
MLSINVDLLLQSRNVVRSKKQEMIDSANKQYRREVLKRYRAVLFVAPQFSSDFVSNFDIETPDSPVRGYRPWAEKEAYFKTDHSQAPEAHHAGDDSAGLESAYMRGVQRMRYIEYMKVGSNGKLQVGQPVYIVNPTPIEIVPPKIFGPDGRPQQMRDEVAITAWESISSYLQARFT